MSEQLHQQPLTFSPKQLQQIDQSLLRLADRIAAPLIMLADVSGRLIIFRGRLSNRQSTGLAALAAGSFAAGVEIGQFLGLQNANAFTQQLQEGHRASLYTVAVGKELLLIIAFTQQTTLGLVRAFVGQTQQEILVFARQAAIDRAQQAKNAPKNPENLGAGIVKQLDDLFTTP